MKKARDTTVVVTPDMTHAQIQTVLEAAPKRATVRFAPGAYRGATFQPKGRRLVLRGVSNATFDGGEDPA